MSTLGTLHRRLYALEIPWAQHLEGSYAPLALIRRLDPERAPFLYLDNGSTELVWSNHDNTAVVRWTLREHGVVLLGPAPSGVHRTGNADRSCARKCNES